MPPIAPPIDSIVPSNSSYSGWNM
uniref:Uncharacterized protein n=1 Tax=Arundo donax TaxID=35708 RepID=A0A0A9BNI5_ARUDO